LFFEDFESQVLHQEGAKDPMNSDLIVPVIMRWLHIFSAIIAVGGSIFIRFVLVPVGASVLPGEQFIALREKVVGRWRIFVHTCILFLLISGFYNYLVLSLPTHHGQAIYHILFGIKFLLALSVFILAIMVTSSNPYGSSLRDKGKTWLGLLVALMVCIVLISGVLKNLPKTTPPAPAAQTQTTQ